MHPLGTVVVEGDHGLDGSAGRIRLSARDIASHRPDVLEHPGFVLLLFLDALVQRIAHVAEFVAAACRGGGHRRAEMPDDVIQVVQEGPVLLQLQAVVDHGVHARLVLQGTPALHCSSKTAT
ncbi:MAG TPA: hypothetical protein VEZ88_03080 [Steroidobacteraceae bacterium]|jgi:hypothetical protein|nr:hypothetical protein [Steroidobacteraceae bacterium]